ncbi:cytochrome P450 [Amycolatopsis cihanbeyliensis]|uniref:Cytochrome P450 n=1 Tax=Amycolatopsis cihanbeyliensis TaxID=1128664 RepID=A0A542CUI2_AMYCI|nr:cytochrome P450 [Amycolatopsis cihanbeyliensis]TQI94486.1 cytochrome P450 [Amycolatopsis cihanbeyliensis]
MTLPPVAAPLPMTRPNPFDPPEELAELRRNHPISRMAYPDGHTGWLVTTHALARTVLADPRFSARSELTHRPIFENELQAQEPKPAPPGMFITMDPPDHTRYRRLLTGQFTVRRMRQLTERIERVTNDHLDAMEQHGPPLDLVDAFARPIPALVICELLGVPYADRDRFQADTKTMGDAQSTKEQALAAVADLGAYLGELVAAKHREPTDDLLSGLVGSGELTNEELTNIAFMLLGAGLDTTSHMLALGTFALLAHPDQLTILRGDPDILELAIEELLRYLSIVMATVRTATEDVELDGHLIRAGESVTISTAAANRDREQFDNPETLDLRRSTRGHVAFGHGIHQCLGQQLARAEMQVAYPALLRRFPTLRLAVQPEEVPIKHNVLIYGLHQLPVAW